MTIHTFLGIIATIPLEVSDADTGMVGNVTKEQFYMALAIGLVCCALFAYFIEVLFGVRDTRRDAKQIKHEQKERALRETR